ncbi:hypothetical protein CONPUDRAFT_31131, partial [Coniophora puteana RWD-64-598 SS2]
MCTVNTSTGFSPFHLYLSCSPQLIPPMLPLVASTDLFLEDNITAMLHVIQSLQNNIADAHNSLVAANTSQVPFTNLHHLSDPSFAVDDLVYLSTKHCRQEYLSHGSKHIAK